jgi:ribonucleoside-diphosphate reductase beta chain
MVIEGMLALTGQHFHTRNLQRRQIMPGHRHAFGLISQDEHRHVAYGTWFLRRHARDPEVAKRIEARLAQILPAAANVFIVGDGDGNGGGGAIVDATMTNFAFTALARRLKVIGVNLPAA